MCFCRDDSWPRQQSKRKIQRRRLLHSTRKLRGSGNRRYIVLTLLKLVSYAGLIWFGRACGDHIFFKYYDIETNGFNATTCEQDWGAPWYFSRMPWVQWQLMSTLPRTHKWRRRLMMRSGTKTGATRSWEGWQVQMLDHIHFRLVISSVFLNSVWCWRVFIPGGSGFCM